MDVLEVKKMIEQELPNILRQDDRFRYLVQDMVRDSFADKQQTENRFEEMLKRIDQNQAENRALREESERKWAEQQAEIRALREESERKWAEQQAENRALREESTDRWNKQQAENYKIWQEVRQLNRKHESSIGALGSRWGLHSEQSFRNALKSILEESFGVQVLNITDYDDEGEVFGHPDQIELDIIIKNGLLIICEIKSSMSKSDMYTFGRKIRFYEKRHQQSANRRIAISPMIDKRAYPVAERLNIELFSYAEDIEPT